ncbi:MAG: UDP-2,3-diacylglucosamine diphosphatase [Pseudomonadota bacterium]
MIFFISDLHLAPERPDITQAFFTFLETTAKGADALYILGDFFDAWVGDDDDTPEFADITHKLKHYQSLGSSVFFMHGNRDFLVGQGFAAKTGARVLKDPCCIDLFGTKTLLMHGDSLCTQDAEYMAFRQMVRNPQWQATILSKPLAERKAIAAQMKATSRSMNSLKAEDIMDVTPEEVIQTMEQHQAPLLIHGHTHRPAKHQLLINGSRAQRLVLGDWGALGWYLLVAQDQLALCSFKI